MKQVFEKNSGELCNSSELKIGELGEIVAYTDEACKLAAFGGVVARTFDGLILVYDARGSGFTESWRRDDVFVVRKLGKDERVILTNEE